MSAKRKDSLGRNLRTGESQIKTGRYAGRYMYKYVDNSGKTKYAYSWKLISTDKVPKNVRECVSLREKEKQIQKDLEDNIASCGGDMTVSDLIAKYVSQKTGVRENTKVNYRFVINIVKNDSFGGVRIDKVKLSDAKAWMIRLQNDGRGYSTLHAMKGVLKPAFQMAVDDDLIRKNPFEFALKDVIVDDSKSREALTEEQQRDFLEFVRNDRHFKRYYEGIYILFHTGLRISEFVGLTMADIDFENQLINVDHQLQRTRKMEYVIEDTKTSCGTRKIPMSNDVAECFRHIIKSRNNPKVEPMIGGRTGFLYLDKNGRPMVALHWEKYFQHIREKYDKSDKPRLPVITPHVCRHTFCSNMARRGMNPKALQKIMGHSEIGITLNVYTHFDFSDVQSEMQRVYSL